MYQTISLLNGTSHHTFFRNLFRKQGELLKLCTTGLLVHLKQPKESDHLLLNLRSQTFYEVEIFTSDAS